MKKLLLYLFAIMAFVACTDSSDNENPNNSKPNAPEITLDTAAANFTAEGGSTIVTFTSSDAWTAEIINSRADEWCSISPASGSAGNARLTITTTVNDTTDDRTATVIIKSGTTQKTIAVSQKQKDALTVTSSKFEISADGGEVEIEVKANIDFNVEIEESAKSWVTHRSTRAMRTSTLIMEVDENDGTEKRKADISISGNGLKETITIYQEGDKPTIVLSQDEYTVPSAGETIAVEVKSNVDVTVEIPQGASWITENTTRGVSTNTYYFDIEINEEYEQRNTEIKFTNKANNLSEVVKITQTQKDALVVAKESYMVNSDGGQIEIEVGHNVDFDVEISADWISREQTRAFTTETLTFNIAQNPNNDNREGTIIFKSKDGNLSQIVKVYQTQKDALIVSKKDIVVNDESGTVSFEIQTNVEFKVSDPNVSWLRAVQTRGLTSHTLTYEYDANTSYDSREANIVVTNIKTNKSETIIITQAQKDAIVLAKSEYEFGVDGGNLDFEVQTNVDITVTISDNVKDWIQQVETRGLMTKNLHFNIAPYSGTEGREGTITISGGKVTQTITVRQTVKEEIDPTQIPDNQIWYTATAKVAPYYANVFGATIVTNEWDSATGKGVITFNGEVTSIGDNAFLQCKNLTSVTIPKGVTLIGDGAFGHCSSITSVIIPDGVISIGDNAFVGCRSLTTITIPDSVTSIEGAVFSECSSLTSVIIGNNVTSIGNYTFSECISLTNVTIPDSVTEIGEKAFRNCSSLTSINIPNNVTSIGYDAFKGCSSLTAFYGKYASKDNRCLVVDGTLKCFAPAGLTEYTISSNVIKIGNSVFEDCDSLTSVTIPDSVTEIGEKAFYSCSSLTSITIPDSVTSIGESAFSFCGHLTSLTIGNGVTSIGGYAFEYCSSLTSITIPDSVTEIGSSAFAECTGELIINSKSFLEKDYTSATYPTYDYSGWLYRSRFSSLVFGDNVTKIGNFAFKGCYRLTSVTIPDSVTKIGNSAFNGCSSLTSVTIPDSVTEIGNSAFSGCKGLTSVTIGNGVTSIGEWAFKNCSSLASVIIGNNVTSIGDYTFSECSSLTSVTIPDSVTEIGNSAFGRCSSLASVTIPDSITEIKNDTFSYCSSLTSVTIPGSVISIGDYAFYQCSCLTSAIIPNSVTSIGDYAFGFCGLISVTIPDSVKEIGNFAFGRCSSLASVTVGNGVTSIGISSFKECSSLTSVTIPESVTSIKSEAFYGCSSLTNITIPDSVTSIKSEAFYGCSSLTNITIPKRVTEIGRYAFYGCSSLISVYCKPPTPPTGNSYMFNSNASGRRIYAPTASVEAYKTTKYWSDYADYIFADPTEN